MIPFSRSRAWSRPDCSCPAHSVCLSRGCGGRQRPCGRCALRRASGGSPPEEPAHVSSPCWQSSDRGWDSAYRPLRRTGPLDEKTRPPFENSALGIGDARTQQPQPAGWASFVKRWLLSPRSSEAWALRRFGSMPTMAGAPRIVRGASAPQAGQAHGSRNVAIGRIAVNGPHAGQS